jgi:membrane protease YdiL (CAAX protease family)
MMLDIGLAAVLLIGIPALALRREASGVHRSRIARYRSATLMIVGCVGVLALQWIVSGRNAALLGLNLPPTSLGWSCLFGVALLLAALGTAMRRKPCMPTVEGDDDPLPQTPAERTAFILFALVAGTGWEILYRGFLLWFLTPLLGLIMAVCVTVLAYGVAHGVRDARKAAASIGAALLFTIGFSLTHDLWWLMLIHAGVPLVALTTPRSATRS